MFDLRTASIGIRKACALRGVRSAFWQPMYDGIYDAELDPMGDTRIIVEVHASRGKVFSLTIGEVNDADDCTWREINDTRRESPQDRSQIADCNNACISARR